MSSRDPSRRDVLRLAGAALVASCGDNLVTRPPGGSHALAVLEPDETSFVVSAWSPLARSFVFEIRSGGEPVRTLRAPVSATQQAWSVIDGLIPGTLYEVSATSDDAVVLGPARVVTAPTPGDPRAVRLAVTADLDPSPEFVNDLCEQLAASAPDLHVSIGDAPYTDNGPPATTVATYRERHAELRTTPRVRTLLDAAGMRAIYDDHEFRNDWDAHFVALEPDRYAAAMQVWDEFFPLPSARGEVRYRNFRWGASVECFVLDCRRFRSANADPDTAAKTMLGPEQKAWLFGALAASTATFKLVFTSVPLDYGIGVDHWAGYTVERQELFEMIRVLALPGVLFVSGDQHYFAAYRHAYGLREFQIGPLARGIGMPGPDAPGVLFRDFRYNFGLIDVVGDQLTFSGVGVGGEVFYKETFTAAQLAPQG